MSVCFSEYHLSLFKASSTGACFPQFVCHLLPDQYYQICRKESVNAVIVAVGELSRGDGFGS